MLGSFDLCPHDPQYDNGNWQRLMRGVIYLFVVFAAYVAGYRNASALRPALSAAQNQAQAAEPHVSGNPAR
jgi:hypothetical protein